MASKTKNNEKEQVTVTADQVGSVEETGLVPQDQTSTEVGFPIDFAADAGMGNQDVSTTDLALPFLAILQKNSPQVDDDSDKRIPNAKVGMIFNTVTGELYDGKDKGIDVIPCYFIRKFVEWVPRESGGGFVASYDPEAAEVRQAVAENLRNDKGKLIRSNGNLLTETAYHYVLLLGDDSPKWAIISMASTQLKPSRTWNSLISGIVFKTPAGKPFNPPRFSHVYRLSTNVQRKGENTWYTWSPKIVEMVKDGDLYKMAKAYAVAAPSVNVSAPPAEEHEETESEGRGDRPFGGDRTF